MSSTVEEQTGQTTEGQTTEGQTTEGQTTGGQTTDGEQPKTKQERSKAPDTSAITADAINAAELAIPAVVRASQPTRNRKPEQLLMDAVAAKAYTAWVKADKPTAWDKTPVVTYFLNPDEVKGYRYLITHACLVVPPVGEIDGKPVTGVRARFGNMFTLSEELANDPKVNRPEDAGKTVLSWAAIDKRTTENREGQKTTGSEKPKTSGKRTK